MVPADSIIPISLVGIALICMGVFVVRRRQSLNEYIQESQRKLLGRKVAAVSAGRQTPFMMGVVGVLITLIGISLTTAAIVGIIHIIGK